MLYRVLKAHDFVTQTGSKIHKEEGSLVEVMARDTADRYKLAGIIGQVKRTHKKTALTGKPAQWYTRTKRVGLFVNTSQWYSGGRIHLYQIALSLAQMDAEVYIITDGFPTWQRDYPDSHNLQVIIAGSGAIPPDLDIIITDAKGGAGKRASEYKRDHPRTLLTCLNFETPNWVEKFCPDYARALNTGMGVYQEADLLLANSQESALWLNRWLKRGDDDYVGVVLPAVNTFALDDARRIKMPGHDRPFAVWSARGPSYKGGDVAIEAINELPMPFDLVMIGQPGTLPQNTAKHKFTPLKMATDVDKYALMMQAACVLAPSKFEGCGMVPMEALACGTPCITYDLPVLREVYGSKLIYAKWGDRKDFKRFVKTVAEGAVRHENEGVDGLSVNTKPQSKAEAKTYGMEQMRKTIETIPHLAMNKKRISVQMLAYWGFAPEAMESIYEYADEIFVAFGRVPHAQTIDDGSWQRLLDFPDPDKKIVIENRDEWQGGKVEMRNWCLDQMNGNYHLVLDGDEIWTGLDKWIEADIPFGCPRWVNFWHDAAHWVHDYPAKSHRWGAEIPGGGSVCPHYRWSWLRRSYSFKTHPSLNDADGNALHIFAKGAAEKVPECKIYHLGHALPKQVMDAKHNFYLSRDGNDEGRKKRKTAWHEWDGQTGDCGDGIIKPVDWDIPEIVKRAYERVGTWNVK